MPDLLNTSDVPLAPSAKTSETVLPDWYTNYAMQVLSNQQATSGQPYTAYTAGPRVADFTPDQQAGFEATRGAATAYQPFFNQAGGALTAAASGPTATSAANPWIQQSGALASTNVDQYMSPYIGDVVNRIADLGNRNLTEKLLPQVSDTFVGSGGFGGTRQAEAIGRALRDTQEGISAQQAQALNTGYQGALTAAQTDLSRQAQLGQLAGQFATSDINSGIATGGALTSLGQAAQSAGLAGAGALQGVGQQQQQNAQQNLDVGYQDFLRQQGWDQSQIDNLVKTLQGVAPAVPKSVLESGYGPAPAGSTNSPSTAQAIASLLGSFLLS